MKKTFESIIEAAGKRSTLTQEERGRMRTLLYEYAAYKPITATVEAERSFADSFFFVVKTRLARPLPAFVSAVLILAVSTGGVAFAAEGSLPGDALYGVKVGVTEPARVLLATTPADKAAIEMQFAERRVDEAVTLAHEGALSSTTEAALAQNFTTHAAEAQVALEEQSTTTPLAAGASTEVFNARLAAYASVLAQLDAEHNATSTTALRYVIAAHIASTTNPHETYVSVSTTTVRDLEQVSIRADRALKESADLIGSNQYRVDATTTTDATDELAQAAALAEQGRTLLKQGDTKGAYHAFQDSLSRSGRLEVLTRTTAKFDLPLPTTAANASSTATTSPSSQTSGTDSDAGERKPSDTTSSKTSEPELPDLPLGL